MSDVPRVVRLLREGRDRRARELAPAPGAPIGAGAIGLSFQPGDRVFDRVTGETGVVLGGQRENIITESAE